MENDSLSRSPSSCPAVAVDHPGCPETSAPERGSVPSLDELWARPVADEGFDVYAGCALAGGTIPPGQMFLP